MRLNLLEPRTEIAVADGRASLARQRAAVCRVEGARRRRDGVAVWPRGSARPPRHASCPGASRRAASRAGASRKAWRPLPQRQQYPVQRAQTCASEQPSVRRPGHRSLSEASSLRRLGGEPVDLGFQGQQVLPQFIALRRGYRLERRDIAAHHDDGASAAPAPSAAPAAAAASRRACQRAASSLLRRDARAPQPALPILAMSTEEILVRRQPLAARRAVLR